MKLGHPIGIADGVFQIRAIGARVTVLRPPTGAAILIDTGSRGSLPWITGGLEATGMSLRDIGLVVLTHHHPDHAGGLPEIVKAATVHVAAHRLEAPIIAGEVEAPNPFQNNGISRVSAPFMYRLNGVATAVAMQLEDGQTLRAGMDTRIIHMPGHTPGSIALHLPGPGIVIVGDALQYRYAQRLAPPARMFTADRPQALKSLERLMDLDFETIVFSHFPAIRYGAKDALGRMLTEERVTRNPYRVIKP